MAFFKTTIPIENDWQFQQADHNDCGYRPVAQFPTQVHVDLLHHKAIPDPFVGKNELAVQWVGEKAWVYRTTFATPPKLLAGNAGPAVAAVLAFDGLDTFANVRLNGQTVLQTDNMFVSYRVDVTHALLSSANGQSPNGLTNELTITFESAYLRGWDIVDQYPKHKWGCWNGDASRLGVRKAQYHWGWDWGPVLLTCGPWRPIRLELYNARIVDLAVHVDVEATLKSANVVHTLIEGMVAKVCFEIHLEGRSLALEEMPATSAVVVGRAAAASSSATFRVQNPELWYPAQYGNQPLYTIKDTLLDGDGRELDTGVKRIGMRRVEVVQRPLQGQPGMSFFFRVNNVPIFCGGSNWIPADNLVSRLSRERYLSWIRLVAEGNQCMIRVWGGGIYEEEAFYDACDETGILVWQDFMFACGNYPAHPEFLASVEREARDNVKRLRHHPSIVLWAGNNEDYSYAESEGLGYDPNNTSPASWLRSKFPARFIYEKLLADVCKDLIPSTVYRPGSPWGGKTTSDQTMGDIHQWNVWHGTQEKWQNLDNLVGRFVSEFGMEALPSVKTVEAILPQGKDDADRYAQSSTLDFHNKAAGHERRIALYLAENFRYNPDSLGQYIYSTQLMQAECLATAYRLWKREWRGPGREYCAGALVWQMNDCWPVTSWSLCDHYLRPKLAYYAVKRELLPLTVGMKRRETTHSKSKHSRTDTERRVKIEVWAANLGLEDRTADCIVKAWDVETGDETFMQVVSPRKLLSANRSTEIVDMDVPVAARDAGLEERTVVAAYLVEDGVQVARYVNWPEPFKYLHLQKPRRLQVSWTAARRRFTRVQRCPSRASRSSAMTRRCGLPTTCSI